MDSFLERCFYHSGQYNSEASFTELDSKLKKQEVSFPIFVLFFSILNLKKKPSFGVFFFIASCFSIYSWFRFYFVEK